MFNLIKNNIIQFDKLIIDKYFALNLDEIDTIILIRLNDLLKRGERLLSVRPIAGSMKINEAECGQRIVDLVKRGFITLELSEVDSKEVFSLDETYRRLAYLLEASDDTAETTIINEKIKYTIRLLENEMKKTLSPIELEIVSRWYIEKKYSDKVIDEAIFKALKNKNRSVGYIDRLLTKEEAVETKIKKPADGESIQDLFRKVYVKSK
ncbi:MAG: DnaD domain protein [Bacilli bacterium]|nr:DnaD domain protein [Bacilli bacterium]MDD4076794.1 DnaD domain protein [Bacilli bacterium]MDD4388030.1 DnaD domain protein [Bacilli bacterium]